MVGSYNVYFQQVAGPQGVCEPRPGALHSPMSESTFFKGLVDGMRCGILSIDRSGRLVVVNDLAAQILDLDGVPAPGADLDAALSEHPRLIQVLRDCFDARNLPNREELLLGRDARGGKSIGYTVSLIANDDGEPAGAAMFFKDLTLIERQEEQDRLQDRLAALGHMAACMAHEIRNPLTSIEVTCSLLRRRLPAEGGARELLDKITAEVRRLNGTITSGLEFVRPVSLSHRLGRILDVLDESIRVVSNRTGGVATVTTRCPDDVPEFLMDHEQLRQVFENLLINAVQAAGAGGRIDVEVRVSDVPDQSGDLEPWVHVAISDSGAGIPEGDEEKIFYPFFTTKKAGSGVGLSMVKKIVGSHRGVIEVANAASGGAVFTVRIPMLAGQPED